MSNPDLRVPGFQVAGLRCGVKERNPDLALIVCDRPAAAAGVFTRSTVVGAPVALSREHLRGGRAQAIVVNSGVANVAMGARGERDALAMAQESARHLGCDPRDVLVASTGVIGEPLPMKSIRKGIGRAAKRLSDHAWPAVADAILTTDTVPKMSSRQVDVGGRRVALVGVAKGSGMIEPNMATMLAFLTTDAAVSAPCLRRLLREAVDESFNRVTVDGEGSTSDSVMILAGGAAGNAPLRSAGARGAGAFRTALREVCTELAQAIARDGEGATKLVRVDVEGAKTPAEADRAARRIANSLLVKTALFGGDPNWGRILQTLGADRITLRLDRCVVRLGGVSVFAKGRATGPAGRKRAEAALRGPEVTISVALGAGRSRAHLWTCDLSYDYVRINAEYHT